MKREGILRKIDSLCIKRDPSGKETRRIGAEQEELTILWWDYTSEDQEAGGSPKEKWHVNLNIYDDRLTGTITGYPEDDPMDVFCFSSKNCDTSEKILEFLDKDFAAWTCNMRKLK